MFQYHAETAFSLQLFSSNHQIHIILFLYRIRLRIERSFLHTDPSLRPYSHQLLYICECVVVVVEEAGEDGLGGRESYVEEGSSLSQNVPLHTPPPPPWSSRPYLSEKKVLFHRGVQYLKYKMKSIQKCCSTVRKSQLYY